MAGTASVVVTKRISTGGTEYQYIGTLTPDASYKTGGATLEAAAGSPYKLPSTIDAMVLGQGSLGAEYVPSTGKVKLYLGAESGSGLKGSKEATEGTDYSAVVVPFVAWGP